MGHAMVTSPTGRGVIIMGGTTGHKVVPPYIGFSKAMFELSISMEWTRLEQTLKYDHNSLLARPCRPPGMSMSEWRNHR